MIFKRFLPGPRCRTLAFAALVGTIAFAPPAAASGAEDEESGNLDDVIRTAATQVVAIVKDKSVSVGQITPTNLPDANGGPVIEEKLKQAIDTIRPGAVRRTAPFSVKGDIELKPHPVASEAKLGQKVIRLIFRVIDNDTDESKAVTVTRFVRDNSSIIRLLGISGALPLDPKKDQGDQRRERNKEIQDRAANPKTFIDPNHPSIVSSSAASPYKVEILAGPLGDGTLRPTEALLAKLKNDLAFVDVDRGKVYEVRIHNASPEEVAVRVFIDGLDVFHFSEDRDPADPTRSRFSHFIVPPASAGTAGVETIPGWHKSLSGKPNFLAFLVTAYGAGASSKAGVPASGPVGVIQVQFSRCYPRLPGQKRGSSNETGFGPPRDIKQTAVEREIEPPTDVVSVRYTR
jgi:hypothetical protein